MLVARKILLTGVCAALAACGARAQTAKVSTPNHYEGYSPVLYDGTQRASQYIAMRDGTKIAIDIFRPTRAGRVTDDKLPVVWMHTPYNRRTYSGGPAVERYPGFAIRLAKYGYVVAVADFRGVYASYGHNEGYNRGEWNDASKWDSYDITEWLAGQPWSTGAIGMWGCSATGGSQMQALTVRPPHLKAVIPMSAEFDAYSAFIVGGVSGPGRVAPPGQSGANSLVARRDMAAVPVDGADAEDMLRDAVASHADNIESAGNLPYRDTVSEATGDVWWRMTSPASYLDALKKGGIGVMDVANWDEAGTRHGPFFTFNNVPNAKLLVGPSTHCAWTKVDEDTGFDLVTEELRFYDYWLKGKQNHVMDEPAVTYYTYHAAPGHEWSQSPTWPLKSEKRTNFYLTSAALSDAKPASRVTLTTDFSDPPQSQSTTIAPAEGGLVFETRPLTQAVQITGHPAANLWISTAAGDVDVDARIDDVAPDGTTESYQMVGRLRASDRALGSAPYNYLGLPWHPFTAAAAQPMPKDRAENLQFELLPMSYVFQPGHKIRVTVTFSDPQRRDAVFKATLVSSPDQPSFITLPIVPLGG